MGTASLVFGFLTIGLGVYFEYLAFFFSAIISGYDLFSYFLWGIILFVIGGLLLRKFDNDRKKEKSKGL